VAECDPPPDVPKDYQEKYRTSCAEICAARDAWRPAAYSSIRIGSGVPGLGYVRDPRLRGQIKQVIDCMVDAMHLDILHFSIPFSSVSDPAPWQELLDYAKSKNVQTMIIAEDLDSNPTWDQYKELHRQFVSTWAGAADRLMAVSDPTFPWDPACRISDRGNVTVEEFAQLAGEVGAIAKAKGPTLCGLPGHYSTTFPQNGQLLDLLKAMPEYDTWSIYYYSIKDLNELPPDIEAWRAAPGKDVWMLANYATANREDYYQAPWLDHLIGRFVGASINYCEQHAIRVWEWAWPTFFWTYRKATPTADILNYRTDLGNEVEYWARFYDGLDMPSYPYPPSGSTTAKWWIVGATALLGLIAVYALAKRSR